MCSFLFIQIDRNCCVCSVHIVCMYVCVMCIFTKSHNISFVCCLLRVEVWGYGFMVGVGLLSGVSISLAIFAFSSFRLHQTCIHTRRYILYSMHALSHLNIWSALQSSLWPNVYCRVVTILIFRYSFSFFVCLFYFS